MKTKICPLLLLLSVFKLNLCLIQVDSDCRITVDNPSAADFDDFNIHKKIKRKFSQVLILKDKKDSQCKFVVKEVRYLKNDANIPARNDTTGANAGKQTNSESGHEISYSLEEHVKDEVHVMKKLSHSPHFPKYYSHFEEDHKTFVKSFIIMEYVEGENLDDLIENGGVGESEKRIIAAKLADYIQEMHLLKIVHRDIKPLNIIYNRQSRKLTIIDFGISKQLNSLDEKMHQSCGSILFMAPELATMKSYDYTVDWYAYGKTLLVLFGGTTEIREEVINNKNTSVITNKFDALNYRQYALIAHCIGADRPRIRNLMQIKNNSYFEDFNWDSIEDRPNAAKLSVFNR